MPCVKFTNFLTATLHFSDAVSDLALHFLAKLKIMVISDIERNDVDFITKVSFCRYIRRTNFSTCHNLNPNFQSLGVRSVASIDHFVPESLGSADLVEEIAVGRSKLVKVCSKLLCCSMVVHYEMI